MTKALRGTLDKQEVRILADRANRVFRMGRIEESLSLAENAVKIASMTLEPSDPEYILAFNRLAGLAMNHGEDRKALDLLTKVFPNAESALGPTDIEFIILLNNLSLSHWRNSSPDLGLPFMKRAIELKRSLDGVGNVSYAGNLNDLILMLEDLSLVAETEPYVRELSGIYKQEFGPTSLPYATSLENLARVCRHVGNEPECQELFRQSRLIKSSISGAKLEEQAKQAYADGDFRAARNIHSQMLSLLPQIGFPLGIGEQFFDPMMEYVEELERRGVGAEAAGDLNLASTAYLQIVEILRTSIGEQSPNVAFALCNLALVKQKLELFDDAKDLFRQSLEILDALEIESEERSKITINVAIFFRAICDDYAQHPTDAKTHVESVRASVKGRPDDYARAPRIRFLVPIPGESQAERVGRELNARGKYYESLGDHLRARFVYEKEVELLRMIISREPERLFDVINELARYYIRIADFGAASSLLEEQTALALEAFGLESVELTQVYRDRAHLQMQLSNFAAAEELILRAQELARNLFGAEHPNIALLDDDLVVVRLSMGRRDEALASLRSIVEQFEKRQDFDPQEAQRIATFLLEAGDYPEAEKLFKRAQEEQIANIGEWDPRYATTMSNIGSLHRATGNFAKAIECFQQSSEIRSAEFGPDHISVAKSKIRLALSLAALRRLDEALEVTRQVLRIGDNLIADVSAISSQRQLLPLLDEQRNNLNVLLSLVRECGARERPDLVRVAYEVVLRRKNLSAEALSARRLTIMSGRYPHLQSKLEELNELTTVLTQARLGSATQDKDLMGKAIERRERLEAELSREIREMRFKERLSDVTVDNVASHLPADAVLIEYTRTTPYNFSAVKAHDDPEIFPPRYYAFVMHGKLPDSLKFVDLGEAAQIEESLAVLAKTIEPGALFTSPRDLLPVNSGLTNQNAESDCILIRQQIFDPLRPLLDGKSRLLIVPDGQLSLLPFDILPLTSGRSMIDDFDISFLSSGRDVLRYDERHEVQHSAPAVVAGPEFTLRLTPNEEISAQRSVDSDSQVRSLQDLGMQFPPLPGAKAEGSEIARLLRDPLILLGSEAKESELRKLKAPALLHLATHGFFLSDTELEAQPDDAMITSGLALAGANNWLAGEAIPAAFEDGILTAEDVATLNLLETDLVVLSACRSGSGDVVTGEGVFGLRRAFFAAGVRTVIMTLWKVPDTETKDLMVHFYQALKRGQTKSSALREAKLAIRQLNPHPFYWGSFVCEGDWKSPDMKAFTTSTHG